MCPVTVTAVSGPSVRNDSRPPASHVTVQHWSCLLLFAVQQFAMCLHSINCLVLTTKTECVYCAVRAESLNKTRANLILHSPTPDTALLTQSHSTPVHPICELPCPEEASPNGIVIVSQKLSFGSLWFRTANRWNSEVTKGGFRVLFPLENFRFSLPVALSPLALDTSQLRIGAISLRQLHPQHKAGHPSAFRTGAKNCFLWRITD